MRSLLLLPFVMACGDYLCLPEGSDLGAGVSSIAASSDISSATTLRHFAWDSLLRYQTVESSESDGDWRRFDYAGYGESVEAMAALEGYVGNLSTVDPDTLIDEDERLAYWLNVYNAWVLLAVAQEVANNPDYNVESDGWLVFNTRYIRVGDDLLTPNEVEHGVLRGWEDQPFDDEALKDKAAGWYRGVWGGSPPDARLHMGLNCASTSCPNLGPGAFQGDRIWDQLDILSTEFVNNETKGAGPNGVSSLFNWFSGDFAETFGSTRAFVEEYRTDGTQGVDFDTSLPYDWSLNAATGEPALAPCGF